MQQGRTKLTPFLLVAAGDGIVHAMAQKPIAQKPDKQMTVYIGGAPAQITKRFCFVREMADVFGIDTEVIAGFDKNAVIGMVVQGPPDIEGKWCLATVMMAFFPLQWKPLMYQVVPLAKIADYPSRIEVHMPRDNSGYHMTVVYMNTDDIYQLFINFDVPGVRKDAGRLRKGVNTGAAGDGTVQAIALKPIAQKPDQQMTVYIGSAPAQITKRFCFVGDMADVFGIDTSVIAGFDKNALIEKVVQGPPDIEGKWNLCTVMVAFAPSLYSRRDNAKKALAKTSIADYPSRMEVQMAHNNVSLPNFLYLAY